MDCAGMAAHATTASMMQGDDGKWQGNGRSIPHVLLLPIFVYYSRSSSFPVFFIPHFLSLPILGLVIFERTEKPAVLLLPADSRFLVAFAPRNDKSSKLLRPNEREQQELSRCGGV
jgi:hypothetical protein